MTDEQAQAGPGGELPPFPLPFATSIAPSDTSTSTVLPGAAEPHIELGRTEITAHSDITYLTHQSPLGAVPLRLDLLVPRTNRPAPLVVYLPGGGFLIAIKEAAPELRGYVAESGFAVASVEYRAAATNATYLDTLRDLKTAIRYLRAHAGEYGYDASTIGVWGESAGGYCAAMLGVTGGEAGLDVGDNLDQSSAVSAVVDNFGPTDITGVAEDFDPDTQAFYNKPDSTHFAAYLGAPGRALDALPEDIRRAADVRSHITANTPPFLLLHGSADTLISPSQTLHLHQALREHGISSQRYVIAGASHGDLSFVGDLESGKKWSTPMVLNVITDFLHQQLDS